MAQVVELQLRSAHQSGELFSSMKFLNQIHFGPSACCRVFAATSISTFVLSVLESLSINGPLSLSDSGALKLGNLSIGSENSILDLPAGIILGVICGLLGAFFIWVSIALGMWRKKNINTPIRKVLEAILFAFTTASVFYLVVWLWRSSCISITTEDKKSLFPFYCTKADTYNPLATLVFNTEGGTIR